MDNERTGNVIDNDSPGKTVYSKSATPVKDDENEYKLYCFVRSNMVERFCGSKSKIEARSWLDVYETMADELTEKQHIKALGSYLAGDALTWYSQEVAKEKMTWQETSRKFIERYGITHVSAAVTSSKRTMTAGDTVQSYAQEKMRLLRLAGVPSESTLDLLTDGMPPAYQDVLYAREPKTFNEWLAVALKLESRRTMSHFRASDTRTGLPIARDTSRLGPRRARSPPPPTPCRYCKNRGVNAYHWHNKCPNRHGLPKHLNVDRSTFNNEDGRVPNFEDHNEPPREYLNSQSGLH